MKKVCFAEGPALRVIRFTSVPVNLHDSSSSAFGNEQRHPSRRTGRALDHLHPSFKGVLALGSEEVNVGLELQFEHVLFVDAVGLVGGAHRVSEQRETRQREIVLMSFVEEQAEVCENHPEFLPAVAVFELSEQISRQLVLHGLAVVGHGHAGVAVPAHMHGGVRSVMCLFV